jgi:2-hydroxy-palmitic acid dioxygenase Mpo1-like
MTESPNPVTSVTTPPRNRPVLRFLGKRLRGWRERHQLPFNFWIHMVGIPLAVAGAAVMLGLLPAWLLGLPWPAWYWGAGGFVLGYLLQYAGHAAEGNDVGEWAAIKRALGLPYVGVSPRWQAGADEKA